MPLLPGVCADVLYYMLRIVAPNTQCALTNIQNATYQREVMLVTIDIVLIIH